MPLRVAALTLVMLLSGASARGADDPPAPGPAPSQIPAEAGEHAGPPQDPRLRKHGDDMASALVVLLGGVLMLATLAFATIILWGRRVRKTLSQAPRRTRPQDELWYLKPKAGLPPEDKKSD